MAISQLPGRKKTKTWLIVSVFALVLSVCCLGGYRQHTERFTQFYAVENALGISPEHTWSGISIHFQPRTSMTKFFTTKLDHKEVLKRIESETGCTAFVFPDRPGAVLVLGSRSHGPEQYNTTIEMNWKQKERISITYRCYVEPNWIDYVFQAIRTKGAPLLHQA